MREMTFGDTIKSSFCIKHKLLIQFKKISFCFLLRFRRKGGRAGLEGCVLAFPTQLCMSTENTSFYPGAISPSYQVTLGFVLF